MRRVGFGRSRLYLDLAAQGRADDRRPAEARGGFRASRACRSTPATGQTIRVRGALDNRLGPRLEVSEPAMIEFLGRSGRAGGGQAAPMIDCVPRNRGAGRRRARAPARAPARAFAGAWRLSLGLAACASVEAPPAPSGVAAARRASRGRPRPAGKSGAEAADRRLRRRVSRARRPKPTSTRVLGQARRRLPTRRASPIASRCSIRRSSTPSPCPRATSS